MVLLAVGVLEERKSPACIVEAFTRVASVHPDAVLIVVGDHPCPYSVALHQVVEEAGLQDRLQLLPITSDIWHWYALADVLISASDVESLPRSMLEAMVFAVPPLCADVFGVGEVVQDDRTGWLFPERDMVALVAALHRVLSLNADELRAVGEACREVALRDHRSEGYGEEYRHMIEAMAEGLREDQKPS
jgi:glycosyltransferase involved in cell wall biosynthesis